MPASDLLTASLNHDRTDPADCQDKHIPAYKHRGRETIISSDRLGADIRVYEHYGTPYAITQSEIDVIQDRNKRFYPPPSICQEQAVQQLEDAHAPGAHLDRHQSAALDRLQALGNLPRWGPDIVIKAFNDLDKIFFMGKMYGHVFVRWTQDHDRHKRIAATHSPDYYTAVTRSPGYYTPRIMIELRSEIYMTESCTLRDTWATLLHEMIHAYFMLVVGPYSFENDTNGPGPRGLGHGPCFQACMEALQYRIGDPRFIRLGVTCPLKKQPTKGGFRRNDDGGASRSYRDAHHKVDDGGHQHLH